MRPSLSSKSASDAAAINLYAACESDLGNGLGRGTGIAYCPEDSLIWMSPCYEHCLGVNFSLIIARLHVLGMPIDAYIRADI